MRYFLWVPFQSLLCFHAWVHEITFNFCPYLAIHQCSWQNTAQGYHLSLLLVFEPWLSNQQFRENSRPGLMSTGVCLNLCWQAAEHKGSLVVKEKKKTHAERTRRFRKTQKHTFLTFYSHSYFNPVDLSSSKQESNVNELLINILIGNDCWQKSITKDAKRQPSSSL